MDSNWNAVQSGAATGPSFGVGPDSSTNHDWRSHLPLDTRQKILNKIMDKLKKHLPVAPENIIRFKNIAAQFEEQIYSAATTKSDYLTKISQKMMSLERKTQINPGQQLQQLISQNQMLHQQQLAMRPKVHQQIQMQISSAHVGGSGMMSAAPAGEMQQSQLNSVQQQPVGRGASFHQQPLMRQQQPQQSQSMMQNPTRPMQQTNNVTDLQQQRLQMQKNQMQQNQLQPNQMLNQQMMLGLKQNLLLGSGGAGNMNKMQRNAGLQQQQQHLLSQLQSQKQQLPQQQQQQREMQMPQRQMQGSPARLQMQDNNAIDNQRQQQQLSMMRQREMQMPQQQIQGSPALLQTQDMNAIYPQMQQQKQFVPQQQLQQQQRVPQDVALSSAPMDSASQTGHQEDWQDEMYQRIKYLKDTYFPDLREVHLKLSIKLRKLDSIVPVNARSREQIEKMKHFKMGLERLMAVLQLGKHNMQIGLKDKLSLYEMRILSILQNHKKVSQQQFQAGAHSDQPHFPSLQHSQPGLQSQQLKQQPQQMDNQNQPQHQLSTSAMIQSNNLRMPKAMQQGMQNRLQLDQLQASGTGLGSLQQSAMGPMWKTINPSQMVGSAASKSSSIMSQTVTMAGMPINMSSAQVLKPNLQHQEQQIQVPQRLMWTQQQTQQRYLQQGAMGPTMQKTMNPPQMVGSGAAISSSIVPHTVTMAGMQTNMRSAQVLKPQQEHQEQQIQPQQCLMQQKQQKQQLGAGLMHNSAAGQEGQPLPTNSAQTGQMGQPQAKPLAVGTPGISASPLPAEFTSPEAGQGTIVSNQVPESETPFQKLARLLRTMPRNQLNAVVKDIASVVSMVDRIPGSALGNGSQAALNDDMVAMTKYRLQAKNLAHPEGIAGTSGGVSPSTKKRKTDSTDQFAGGGFFSNIIKWKTVNPEDPSGGKKTKPAVQEEAQHWIPDEEIIDAIPLRMILPGEEDSISYHPEDSDSHN